MKFTIQAKWLTEQLLWAQCDALCRDGYQANKMKDSAAVSPVYSKCY